MVGAAGARAAKPVLYCARELHLQARGGLPSSCWPALLRTKL